MNVNGTVVGVEFNVQVAKNGGGSYPGARFSYRDDAGALKEQGFHEKSLKFNPALKNQLEQLEVGKPFTMVKEKEGEFWNVKGIYAGGEAPVNTASAGTNKAPTASPNPAPKSTYATAEERAQTQVYIIKQSSLSSAVNFANTLKLKSAKEVIAVAKEFEAYVMGTQFDDGTIMSLQSDDID